MSPLLEVPEALHAADLALQRIGKRAESVAWNLLEGVGNDEPSCQPVVDLKKEAGIEGDEVERLLVWHATQQALPRVASLPVEKWVRERLEQDLRELHNVNGSMAAGSTYEFNRAARMATLRRFPAGAMEWEPDGIPRSYFLKAAFPANLRLLAFVALRVRGLAPCFFMRVAPAPRNRALRVPKQVLRSYYRMVRSMQLQPTVRALVAHAWFHDPAAVRDSPHLAILSEPYLQHGGMIVTLGPAPAFSGVGEGNPQRKEDYMAGKIQYKYGLAIWPREAAIRWADANPELSE